MLRPVYRSKPSFTGPPAHLESPSRVGAHGGIARHQGDGNAKGTRDSRVDRRLIRGLAIKANLLHNLPQERVVQDAVSPALTLVVADEKRRGEALVDSFHLPQDPVAAAEKTCLRVELLHQNIGHRPVAVAHDDLLRSTGSRTLDS